MLPTRAAQCTSAPETIAEYDTIWTRSTGTIKLFQELGACKALQSHWTPTHLLLTIFYKFFITIVSSRTRCEGRIKPELHMNSTFPRIPWRLLLATRRQRSPDPGPWHDVAHSLPAAVPSLNHSPASSLELRITRSKLSGVPLSCHESIESYRLILQLIPFCFSSHLKGRWRLCPSAHKAPSAPKCFAARRGVVADRDYLHLGGAISSCNGSETWAILHSPSDATNDYQWQLQIRAWGCS